MKRIYTANNLVDAQLIQDYLESAGITVQTRGILLTGGVGELPADTTPSIWVIDDADYDRACSLIKNFKKDNPDDQVFITSWTCPGCGEEIEAQFTQCWNCGRQR